MCLLQSFVLRICCVLPCLVQKSKKPNPARAVSLLLYVASFFVLRTCVLLCFVHKSNRDQLYVCCKFYLCYEFVVLDPRRKQSEKTKPASNSLAITDREPATTLVVHYYYECVSLRFSHCWLLLDAKEKTTVLRRWLIISSRTRTREEAAAEKDC